MKAPDLTSPSRALKASSMPIELVNSNHNSKHGATVSLADESQVLERLAELYRTFSLYTGEHDRRLCAELNELRRLRALADERWLKAPNIDGDSISDRPPQFWTVKQMAKALALSEGRVRRLAHGWPFTVCVAHCCACRGGTRGCELRFLAEAASSWLSQRRKKAAR